MHKYGIHFHSFTVRAMFDFSSVECIILNIFGNFPCKRSKDIEKMHNIRARANYANNPQEYRIIEPSAEYVD